MTFVLGWRFRGLSPPQAPDISETVIDRGIFTIEDECKVVCAVSNSAAFDDLE